MAMSLPDPPILVITDRGQCSEPIEARAEKLFQGGCRWLSLREKDMDAGNRLSLLRRLIEIGAGVGARVSVHGDLEAALRLGASLHLPAGSDARSVRNLVGSTVFLGQSCHDDAEVQAAEGADYVTLSPAFVSPSKPGYAPFLSLTDIAAITRRSALPVLALGGVTAENLTALANLGIRGIAVMGGAMRTPEPQTWFSELAARWRTTILRPPSAQP
jgi:thiamine-phosphate pyrophosphorylase